MRLMGLDLGERRIGIALSDPLQLTAQGLSVFQRSGSLKKDLAYLTQIIQNYEVEEVVLGLPKNMNGTEGEMALKVRSFGHALAETTGLKIIFWDERLSTNSAARVMIEADVSRKKRKEKIDQVAAVVILQNFLDFQKRQT